MKSISVVIPTYNEGPRIGAVLEVLCGMKLWKEVIVVDDGSHDQTKEVVAKYPVVYIRNKKNEGKANALKKGVAASTSQVLFFCDADLIGLTEEQVLHILKPILAGEKDLSIGVALHHDVWPAVFLSGQRALTRELWDKMPSFYKKGYRVEVGLNETAMYFGKGYVCSLESYSHVKKEDKRGFWQGWFTKISMWVELVLAYLIYQVVHTFHEVNVWRTQVLMTSLSLLPLLFSVFFFFLSSHLGYQSLLYLFFKEQGMEMQEPFLDFTHLLIRHYTSELYLILGGIFLSFTIGFAIFQVRALKKQIGESSYYLKKLRKAVES